MNIQAFQKIKNLLNTQSLRNRLLLMMLLPCVVLFILILMKLSTEFLQVTAYQDTHQLLEFSDQIETAHSAMQKELVYASIYSIQPNPEIKFKLDRAREITDQEIQNVNRQLEIDQAAISHVPIIEESVNKFKEQLSNINLMRTGFDAKTKNFNQVLEEYQNISDTYFFIFDEIQKNTQDAELITVLQGYISILKYEEQEFLKFMSLNNILFKNNISAQDFNLQDVFTYVQQSLLDTFKVFASPEALINFEKIQQDPIVKEIETISNSVSHTAASHSKVSVDHWLDIALARLNSLERVVKASEKSLLIKAAELKQNVALFFLLNLITLILVFTIVGLIMRQVLSGLFGSLNKLGDAVAKISRGELDVDLNLDIKDEIYELGEKLKILLAANKNLAHAAVKIGKGEFNTEVIVRSKGDDLAHSLNTMKTNLQNLNRKTQEDNWLNHFCP